MKHLFDLSHIELTPTPEIRPLRKYARLTDFVDGHRLLALANQDSEDHPDDLEADQIVIRRAQLLAYATGFHPDFAEALRRVDKHNPSLLRWDNYARCLRFDSLVFFETLRDLIQHEDLVRLCWAFISFHQDCQEIENSLQNRKEA